MIKLLEEMYITYALYRGKSYIDRFKSIEN